MGFEELFENNRNHNGNYRESRYGNETGDSRDSRLPFGGYGNNITLKYFLEKIRSNNKLKLFIVSAGIFILLLAVVLIIVLFPLIVKLLNYISQNGLQSIVESITGFLDKIWKGSAN